MLKLYVFISTSFAQIHANITVHNRFWQDPVHKGISFSKFKRMSQYGIESPNWCIVIIFDFRNTLINNVGTIGFGSINPYGCI